MGIYTDITQTEREREIETEIMKLLRTTFIRICFLMMCGNAHTQSIHNGFITSCRIRLLIHEHKVWLHCNNNMEQLLISLFMCLHCVYLRWTNWLRKCKLVVSSVLNAESWSDRLIELTRSLIMLWLTWIMFNNGLDSDAGPEAVVRPPIVKSNLRNNLRCN